MKKIFIDCRTLSEHSGIGRYIRSILPTFYNLSKNMFFYIGGDVKTIVEYAKKNSWSKDRYSIIPLSSKLYSIKEHLELAIKIPKVDIYWSPYIVTSILDTKAKYRVVTIHDLYHFEFIKELSFFQKLYVKIILRNSLNKSDMVFADSAFTFSQIKRFLSVKNVYKVFSGIDQKKNLNMNREDFLKKICNKYNISKDYFIFVGNIKPHKNLIRSVKAYKLVCKIYKNFPDFLIVGKKEGYIHGDSSLFNLVENDEILKNKVRFSGYVDDLDLPYLYHFSKALVFPSLHEGFGLPPIEAMSYGCPVITSNLTSLPEICGEAVVYVDPYNIEEIANAMRKVLIDRRLVKDLISKGYENIKRFKWEESARKIYNLMQTLDEKN